jgi:hypothetical protein
MPLATSETLGNSSMAGALRDAPRVFVMSEMGPKPECLPNARMSACKVRLMPAKDLTARQNKNMFSAEAAFCVETLEDALARHGIAH